MDTTTEKQHQNIPICKTTGKEHSKGVMTTA